MRTHRPPHMRPYVVVVLLFLALGMTQCQQLHDTVFGPPIDTESSKLVVTAERELANAVDVMHEFWLFDSENHDFLVQQLPQVHALAQQTRTDFWAKYYDPAISATRMYKQTRSSTDATNQEDRLKAVRDLVSQVRQALLRAQVAKAAPHT